MEELGYLLSPASFSFLSVLTFPPWSGSGPLRSHLVWHKVIPGETSDLAWGLEVQEF